MNILANTFVYSHPTYISLGLGFDIGCFRILSLKLSSANMIKGANEITLQKDYESFLIIFHFFYEFFLNEIIYNL
jgi:hypothetical protein